MRLITTSILFALLCFACQAPNTQENVKEAEKKPAYPSVGFIEAFDSSLYNYISKEAKIEVLAEGFTWSEGPVWVEQIQALLFSDVPENKIWKWSEKDSLKLFLEPSGLTDPNRAAQDRERGSNGLILNEEGQLVICQHGDRRIAILDAPFDRPEPSFRTLADRYEDKRFNSPNDLVFDQAGNCYFTDPPYGLPQQMNDPTKEIDFQGVYCIHKDGSLDLLTDALSRPNGIEISNDGKTLYVANSDPKQSIWMAYDLQENGQITNERIFYDATALVGKEGEQGSPDGLVVAANDIIYATGPGGVWVFDPSGKALGKIRTLQATANCTLDEKRKQLYMTADGYLMRLQLKS
ncbi:MAG: SMP-30/gluconolactonase/LRE family protein [Bacteroidota bacterium]